MKRKYVNTAPGEAPTRLGVDIPENLKVRVAIKCRMEHTTMTQLVERLLRSWVDNKITLPEK